MMVPKQSSLVLPEPVQRMIRILEKNGFSAYTVGGCVRDSLIGKTPQDWDLCTSAPPDAVKRCFCGYHVFETGIRHGTLTILMDETPCEITTFRSESFYSDGRHPDAVTFVSDIATDLKRRDFTINAMAYSPKSGLVDLFGGVQDLSNRLIRCVGDAGARFQEDALRILRALRFAADLNFFIEEETEQALQCSRFGLNEIAKERIAGELLRILCGKAAGRILLQYPAVFAVFLPELFEGPDGAGILPDDWSITAKKVDAAAPDKIVRLALLLQGIVVTGEQDGEEQKAGDKTAVPEQPVHRILRRLRLSGDLCFGTEALLKDCRIRLDPAKGTVRRLLSCLGEDRLTRLLMFKRAQRSVLGDLESSAAIDRFTETLAQLLHTEGRITRERLAFCGQDLLTCGIPPGRRMGELLQTLLEAVLDGKVKNQRVQLQDYFYQNLLTQEEKNDVNLWRAGPDAAKLPEVW